MWFKTQTSEELYEALEAIKKRDFGEYVSGKEQYKGPGWYWLEVRSIYFSSCKDQVAMAIEANDRIDEIKEEIKKHSAKLVEARRITRSGTKGCEDE